MLVAQNTNTAVAPAPLANDLADPVAQREAPVAGHHDSTEDVDDLDQEGQESVAAFLHTQQDRLNVVLEKDARDLMIRDCLAMLGDGILVGIDDPAVGKVNGRDYGEIVLEFVKVDNGGVDGTIERVDERWVVRPIRHFRDDVRKVEFCIKRLEDMHDLKVKKRK